MESLVLLLFLGLVVNIQALPAGKIEHLGDAPLYNTGLFEGDIMGVAPGDRHAIVDARMLWPGGVVYYELDNSVENIRSYIMEGLADYHAKTCIRFIERTAANKDTIKNYVKVFWWQGCWSILGMAGGEQAMSLGTGCHWPGLVVHEFGHALGFHHEQARADRDDYIEIYWNNILEGMEDQFTKMNVWESNDLGEHFDYDSIMLYEETAFSKDGVARTIKPKQAGVTLIPVWKKTGLSASDVRRVNRLYQCNGEVRPDPPPVPDFLCDFEKGDCGIVNQENMNSEFRRRVETLGGRTSTVLSMRDADSVSGSGARLITPYFGLFGRDVGCFSFDYFTDGPGFYYFSITFQSSHTREVAKSDKPTGQWTTFKMDVKYDMDKDPRVFILASHMGSGTNFVFAVDNFKFTLNACT